MFSVSGVARKRSLTSARRRGFLPRQPQDAWTTVGGSPRVSQWPLRRAREPVLLSLRNQQRTRLLHQPIRWRRRRKERRWASRQPVRRVAHRFHQQQYRHPDPRARLLRAPHHHRCRLPSPLLLRTRPRPPPLRRLRLGSLLPHRGPDERGAAVPTRPPFPPPAPPQRQVSARELRKRPSAVVTRRLPSRVRRRLATPARQTQPVPGRRPMRLTQRSQQAVAELLQRSCPYRLPHPTRSRRHPQSMSQLEAKPHDAPEIAVSRNPYGEIGLCSAPGCA